MTVRENIEVTADTKKAQKGAKDMEKAFTKSFVKVAAGAVTFTKALSVLTNETQRAWKLAVDYEQTNVKLAAALKNQGLEVNKNAAALNKQSAALETLTGISDENIRSMQALALNMGVGVEQVDDFTRAAIALSNTTGQNANEAMKQLVKTTSGLKGELGEAIPAVRDLTAEQLRAGDAVRVINSQLSENLTILTEGSAGAAHGLTMAWDNFAESLGKSATNSDLVQTSLRGLTSTLNQMASEIEGGNFLARAAGFLGNAVTLGAFEDFFLQGTKTMIQGGGAGFAPSPSRVSPGAAAAGGGGRGGGGGGITMSLAAAQDFEFDPDQRSSMEAMLGPLSFDAQGEQLERQREFGDRLTEIIAEDQAKRGEIVAEGVKKRSELEQMGMDKTLAFAQSGGAAIADVFTALASGQEVVLEKMVKDFLLAQGNMLLAEGFGNILKAAAMAIFNPAGAAQLAAAGAAMVGFGGVLTAGAAAIQAPAAGGGGAGGFTSTAAGQLQDPDQRQPRNGGPVTINIVGDLNDEDGIRIQRALDRATGRGFN